MQINQLIVSAAPGDAVTTAALEIRKLLRQIGPSEIYARYADPRIRSEVLLLRDYDRRPDARPAVDLLLFHASIGEPDVFAFLQRRPERIVLQYHNISPAGPFFDYDPGFAALLDAGRGELAELRSRVSLALADSEFNAAELRDLGYGDVRVSPLIVDYDQLRNAPPAPNFVEHLDRLPPGPMFMFVGQLLPHKRPDLLLAAFHILTTYLLPESHLVLVGTGRLEGYRRSLLAFSRELNLTRLWFTGSITNPELATLFRRADAFVTASEHEGFCVPLVEAMSFDVPIVARACAAIPETVGDAGILLPPEDDPMLMAEAMMAIVEDRSLRATLINRSRRRLRAYAPEVARTTLLENLISVA
jgi:glycosyltransferase involved in cell wall biosynthesis